MVAEYQAPQTTQGLRFLEGPDCSLGLSALPLSIRSGCFSLFGRPCYHWALSAQRGCHSKLRTESFQQLVIAVEHSGSFVHSTSGSRGSECNQVRRDEKNDQLHRRAPCSLLGPTHGLPSLNFVMFRCLGPGPSGVCLHMSAWSGRLTLVRVANLQERLTLVRVANLQEHGRGRGIGRRLRWS